MEVSHSGCRDRTAVGQTGTETNCVRDQEGAGGEIDRRTVDPGPSGRKPENRRWIILPK